MDSKMAAAVLALLVAAASGLYAGGANEAGAAGSGKERVVVIGTGRAYEPFCYYDASGKHTGYDIELLREIDRRLPNHRFEYEIFDFQNVLVSLASGKIDVGAHEFEENPKRREAYLYGEESYNDFNGWLIVKEDGPWNWVKTFDDIAGNPNAVVGVSVGSNYEAFVKTWNETHPPNKQLAFDTYTGNDVGNLNFRNGKHAVKLSPLFDLEIAKILTPDLKQIPVGDKPVIVSDAYFLFKKGDTELQQAFDGVLREMKKDGSLEKLKAEVFKTYFDSL
jgi:L-cystine transport system substrate-binding protein